VDYSSLDDDALVRLISNTSEGALGELYERYNRLVHSLALHVIGDQATAEEITLDVFMRVWERAGTYRSERAKVSTWLSSITRSRSIDELRRRGARPEQHSVSWAEVTPAVHPSTAGPEPVIEGAWVQEQVRAAVAGLPAEQRQILALAYFQGLTQREIADQLNQPLGTVKTRIRLAMSKLRQTLVDEAPA
jgi:RNA polymerase sigma-70 factor (ECF subfamily)